MHISGIDEIDNQLLTLLQQNARYTYSELAEQVGLSRVAVKSRVQSMEEMGLIKGYTVKIAPRKIDKSVEFIVTVCPRPEHYEYVLDILAKSSMIHRVYAATGDCKILAYGVAPDTNEMDAFYRKIRSIFTDVRDFSFDVVASTLKDVDGGIEYARPGEKCAPHAGSAD